MICAVKLLALWPLDVDVVVTENSCSNAENLNQSLTIFTFSFTDFMVTSSS